MASSVLSMPFWRVTDRNGNPVNGALVKIFSAVTEIPATTYSDYAQATPHPASIPTDDAGLVPVIYAPDGTYKIRVTYSVADGEATIFEVDNYTVDLEGTAVTTISLPVVTKTTNYTLVAADRGNVFLVDPAGGNVVITADSATLTNGFPFWVVNIDATGGTVTIQGTGGQLINGAASKSLTSYNQSTAIVAVGAGGWQVIGEAGVSSLPVVAPGGRLTLATGEPVLTSDQTAKTTVFYTPHMHGYVMLYNGISWTPYAFSELSQTLADATKSPAAAAVSSNYDMFIWLDGATIRCTRGPAWTNLTTRSAGTALVRVNGIYLNNAAITNGPAASRGVYVGTISTDATGANGQLNMMFAPAAAAGGTANRLDVWNMYNRVNVAALNRDSTNTWTYAIATWRAANAAAGGGVAFRVTVVAGLNENALSALYAVSAKSSTSSLFMFAGIGIDSTTAISGFPGVTSGQASDAAPGQSIQANYSGLVGLGSHFIQAMEKVSTATTGDFYGDNGAPADTQSGLLVNWRM